MRGVRFGASRGDFVRLFEGESVAGLGEGELLARFVNRRDEAAFEALVTRLGPMVLGVARRMLSDPHDVDDAFQATFLVLVRRAGSIRDRDLVAAWLHGVASKVARRARAESTRRKARERVAMVPEAVEEKGDSGWLELRALIDEEIERLPEEHRRAVVLCDVEGLSREEAALRLGWSLNMVRGRLERARGRLRGRLARRGVAPSGAWMALKVVPPVPSPSLVSATIRASLAFSSSRMATGLASASAVALSKGVLRMMMLSKLKVGLAVLVSAGFVAGGTGMLAAQGPGDKPGVKAAKAVDTAEAEKVEDTAQAEAKPAVEDPSRPRSASVLAKARVQAARRRYKTQLAFYEEGRITLDRLVDASRGVMLAEINDSGSKAERVAAARRHYDRLAEILKQEKTKLAVGQATAADVDEIQSGLLDAEFTLAKELEAPEATKPAGDDAKAGSSPPAATRPSLDQVEIARRIYDQARHLYANARVESAVVLEAAVTLAKVEEGAARTKAHRVAAIRAQVDPLKELVALNEARVQQARGTTLDVDQARLRLLDAESHLLDVSITPDGPSEGFVTASVGKGPIPGPGPSAVKKDASPSTLAKAVEAFNQEARGIEIGRDQPPLTEDEVVAAIRYHVDEGGTSFKKGSLDDFWTVVGTRDMSAGMRLEHSHLNDLGGDFFYEGWWVRIAIRSDDGRATTIPIRSRVIRSLTLEEAVPWAAAKQAQAIQSGTPEGRKMALVFGEAMKNLKQRIERRKTGGEVGR
jgi:RNA polymerase sigma factor (sigma-70 family)